MDITTLERIDASGTSGSVTIDMTSTVGAVVVELGTGSTTYRAGLGDDVITLASADGTDALVMNDAAAGSITINNFQSAGGGDVIDLSIGGIDAWTADGTNAVTLIDLDLEHNASSGIVVLLEVTGVIDFDDQTGDLDHNILVLDSDIASEAALKTALAASGAHEVTTVVYANDEAFMVLWDDGANSYLSAVANTSGSSIDNTTFTTANIAVETFVTFNGVSDATTLTNVDLGTTLIA
ncbi:hypothetical protein N9X08_07400 [Planktomarina temperata]|nr:hypothetical protein [Planktomarina temperata]